jgi:hypothetical protein
MSRTVIETSALTKIAAARAAAQELMPEAKQI